jgi:hypothetical protein
MNRIRLFFAASIAAIALAAGCGSKPQPIESAPRGETGSVESAPRGKPGTVESAPRGDTATESNVTVDANKLVIRDWSYRSDGEAARPAWLLSAQRGNYTPFKTQFGIDPAYTCRIGPGDNVNRNAALIQADVLLASVLARELRSTVLTHLSASNVGISDGEYATALRNCQIIT